MPQPMITDWIQAIGTVVAILFSAVLSLAVPLWVRYLEVKRYRTAFVALLNEAQQLCVEAYYSPESTNKSVFTHQDLSTSRFYSFAIAVAQLQAELAEFPLVMAEMPKLLRFRRSIQASLQDMQHLCQGALDHDGMDTEPRLIVLNRLAEASAWLWQRVFQASKLLKNSNMIMEPPTFHCIRFINHRFAISDPIELHERQSRPVSSEKHQ